jgi:hypothetical protein
VENIRSLTLYMCHVHILYPVSFSLLFSMCTHMYSNVPVSMDGMFIPASLVTVYCTVQYMYYYYSLLTLPNLLSIIFPCLSVPTPLCLALYWLFILHFLFSVYCSLPLLCQRFPLVFVSHLFTLYVLSLCPMSFSSQPLLLLYLETVRFPSSLSLL